MANGQASSIGNTAAYGFAGSIAIGTVDWLFKCRAAHGLVPPDNSLIGMWALVGLPTVHLIGRIINNRLRRLAGDDIDGATK